MVLRFFLLWPNRYVQNILGLFFSLRVRNENFAKFGESGEICRSMKVILGMDNLFPMIISNVTGLGPQLIGWRYKLILN